MTLKEKSFNVKQGFNIKFKTKQEMVKLTKLELVALADDLFMDVAILLDRTNEMEDESTVFEATLNELDQSKKLANELLADKKALRESLESTQTELKVYKLEEARLQGMNIKSNELIKFLFSDIKQSVYELGKITPTEEGE